MKMKNGWVSLLLPSVNSKKRRRRGDYVIWLHFFFEATRNSVEFILSMDNTTSIKVVPALPAHSPYLPISRPPYIQASALVQGGWMRHFQQKIYNFNYICNRLNLLCTTALCAINISSQLCGRLNLLSRLVIEPTFQSIDAVRYR